MVSDELVSIRAIISKMKLRTRESALMNEIRPKESVIIEMIPNMSDKEIQENIDRIHSEIQAMAPVSCENNLYFQKLVEVYELEKEQFERHKKE